MAADNRPHFQQEPRDPAPSDPGQVHIAAELKDLEEKDDKARAFVIVGIVLVVIAILVGLLAYTLRPTPKAVGAIDEAYAVALPGDNVLSTIKVTFRNIGGKPLWIRNLKAQLATADGKQYKDEAANAVDFDRYFLGFPDLRDHSLQPLKVETRLEPGEQTRGSVIVSFPVTLDTFNRRKSLAVIIEPYDQPSVTITK
jgi:hypothetical protein